MAQAPYNPVPTVEPQTSVGNDYQNIQARPEAFGATIAQGVQQVGQGALKAAHFYGEVAADQSVNNWQDEVNHLLYGDPAKGDVGVYGLKGQAGMDAAATVGDKISKLRDQYRGQLLTPEQQLMFDNYTRRTQNYLMSEIGRHYDAQASLWATEVGKASDNLALQHISQHADDPEQVNHGTADLITNRLKQLQITAGLHPPNELVDSTLLDARRDAALAQIRSLMADPAKAGLADHAFAKNEKLFKGSPALDALSNELRTRNKKAAVGQLVEGAIGGGGTVSPQQVGASAQAQGVDPALATTTAAIESNFGANVGAGEHAAVRGNIFQMGPSERIITGGTRGSMGTADEQINQGVRYLAINQSALHDSLGREPTNAEVYLAHQQGAAGAGRLISNPARRAGDIVGDAAIRDNGGDPNAPAAQFVAKWRDQYNATEQNYRSAVTHHNQATQAARASGQPMPPTMAAGVRADYATALARIESSPVDPEVKAAAITQLHARFAFEQGLAEKEERDAEKNRIDDQRTVWSRTMAGIERGQPPTHEQLATLLESRQIDQSQYASVEAKLSGRGERDDPATYATLNRRSRAGEDVTQDVYDAIQNDKLRPQSADTILNLGEARRAQRENQTASAAFATLRTVAGMDAQDHPMVNLTGEAQAAQVQLWGQAQQEWNQRVHANNEKPMDVLQDMIPRYEHPIMSVHALPQPRLGAIAKPEDIALVLTKTQAAFDVGQLTRDQYYSDVALIKRYEDVLNAQQKRQEAAKAAAAKNAGRARGRSTDLAPAEMQ